MVNRRMPHVIFRWLKICFSVMMITSLIAGCRLPWQSLPEAGIQETGELDVSVTPTPTREPRPDLPPALVEVWPLPASLLGLTQPIKLFFNQAMDAGSVEAALHFEPRISGRFDWEDAQTVVFSPDQPLAASSRLQLTLDTSAQAVNQKQLQAPVELSFTVADHLQVVHTVPANGTQDVDPESVIFVVFNQPVVDLGDASTAEPGFTLSPEVTGTGAWLNTSTFVFTPDPCMDGGTEFTIQLNQNLVATSGAGFASTQVFSYRFTTKQPEIVKVLPMPGELLSLDGPVEINFNLRMDTESVEANFSLVDLNGNTEPGQFEWDQHDRQLKFTPARLLARDTTYFIRLGSDARGAGGLALLEALDTTRRTFPEFSIVTSTAPQFESYYGGYGQYTLEFTTPFSEKGLDEHIRLEPELSGVSFFNNPGEGKLWVNGYFQPETAYTLTIDADLQDVWGSRLGEPFEITFFTPPAPPSVSIVSGYVSYNLVFVPASAPELNLQGTNINSVSVEIAPISFDDLITLLHPDNYRYREIFLPEVREVTTYNLDLSSNRRDVFTLPLLYQGEPLLPGIYYLGVQAPDIPEGEPERNQKYYLIVSENNLVLKVAPEQAFVWATRFDDLSPLVDAPVGFYSTEGDLLTRGSLDMNGQFRGEFERVENPYGTFFTLVGTPGEADFAFSISSWQDSYALYERGIQIDTFPALLDAYIYSDRPIYRPGDTIHFKVVVFSREDGQLGSPGLDSVRLTLQGDPGMSGRSATYFDRNLALSRFGTASGSVDLPVDAPTGYYWIDVSVEETTVKALYFDVAAYRKPDIDVTVSFEDAELLAGDAVVAGAQADYYFGLPAADQPFSWGLYRQEAEFYLPGYRVGPLPDFWGDPFFPGLFSPLGERILSGDGRTDDEGLASLSFSGDALDPEESRAGSLQQYSLEFTVMDQSGFPVSYTDSILVHPGEFYIGVKPDAYFGNAGLPFNFSIITVDWDKAPVSNISLEASFETIRWEVEETGNPEQPYEYLAVTNLVAGASPVTDRSGKAQVTFTPQDPGMYRLTLEAEGAQTQVLIWVSGESAALWPVQMDNWIDLTADSDAYQPGETAQIFIPSPFPGGAKALVTVERGAVTRSQVLDVSGSGTTATVPITSDSIPNLYVSVILMGKDSNGKPDYRQGMLNLPVSAQTKTLNIDLAVDPVLTEPGEQVALALKITDQAGNPIQGEFSVAVVDKALLALVPPNSPPIMDAIYKPWPLSVQTSLSLYTYAKQLSISPMEVGGLGGGADLMAEAGIREDFPDTAYWQAEVITGVDGTARLTIPLPDSLTTWVVDVRGLADDYLVGQGEVEVQTQKPLMIRPVTPRFLVDGDLVELAAIVHNNSSDPLEVDVSLLAVGFDLTEANPLRKVTIDSGQSERVTWWGTVESVALVDLVFQAVAGELADASKPIWGDLQVKRYVMPQTFSTAGQLAGAGERLELVSLPITTDPSSGELSIALNPSLLATLVDGLEALESVPYNDTVSILSRLLANLNTYLVLRNLELGSDPLVESLDALIGTGIDQLLTAQDFDGGWSWWGESGGDQQKSNPFITAYVLLGLETANQAGIDIGEHFLTRAKDYLIFELQQPGEIDAGWRLDELTFVTYALRGHDFDLSSTLDGLYARRSELSPWALGLLALTMREQGGMGARVNTLVADIEARAIRSATGVHWENERMSWMLPGTPVFNTAVAVYTLAQLDPASTSLPLALGYLMMHRQNDGLWTSSFESAWVLMAVAKTVQGTGDYLADFEFQAALNDVVIAEGLGEGPDVLNTVFASTPIAALYPDTPNTVLISRGEGAGTLYYRVDLSTYQLAETATAIQGGINLQRDYYLAGEGCPGVEGCEMIDSITLDPANPGQFIKVVLTVNLPHDMYNLLVEDYIPAGAEVLNQRLLTSPTVPDIAGELFDPCDPFASGWGWWYFDSPQVYDDHVLWTANYVPAGTYILTYDLLPFQRGTFQVLPAHAWQMFYPEVQGTTSGNLFTIE